MAKGSRATINIWSENHEGNSPEADLFERKQNSDRERPPSSRGYANTEFKQTLKELYQFRCLACKFQYKTAESSLEACHILEVEEVNHISVDDQILFLTKCGLVDIHDRHNFILLCTTCHIHFDKQLLGIRRDGEAYKWVVKPTLHETPLPHSPETYGTLVGTQIQFPFGPPMPQVIDHRYERYVLGTSPKRKVNRNACVVIRAASFCRLL